MTRKLITRMAAGATLALAVVASPTIVEAQSRLNVRGSSQFSSGPAGSNLLVDFLLAGAVAGTPTGNMTAIETISGAFDPEIVPGTVGVIQDIQFAGTTPAGLPMVSFLTIGGYNFTLEGVDRSTANFGPVSIFELPGGNTTLSFGVFGSVMGPDIAPPRNFTGVFSAQFAGQTSAQVMAAIMAPGGTLPVSISAEFIVADAQVIPEPSTYILLATGLGGLGLVGLRRRATQA